MTTNSIQLKTPDQVDSADGDHWPKAAASVALFRGADVLLIERAKGVRAGLWSLPGGHIEAGETARAAAARELAEETGLNAVILGLTDIHDVIIHDAAGALQAHYLLAVFYGRWSGGDPTAATDAKQALFVAPSALANYNLTPGTSRLIALAAAKLHT